MADDGSTTRQRRYISQKDRRDFQKKKKKSYEEEEDRPFDEGTPKRPLPPPSASYTKSKAASGRAVHAAHESSSTDHTSQWRDSNSLLFQGEEEIRTPFLLKPS
mmetsp:Transcript_34994/g.51286  ORF Transcript_34994/g.51286 Transcript_34994/m.51286 type:complete len:104 (+) Transcript_34994:191-502(+)